MSLTASFGCASSVPGLPISSDLLIRRADEACYLAKRQGRNRVESFTSFLGVERPSVQERLMPRPA